MVTDLAEVFRLGTAKAEENLEFRRRLSSRHYPEEPFQILATEIQKQVDCTKCANCCRHSIVPVSNKEIEHIAEHLGTSAGEILRLYTVPDPEKPGSRILSNSAEGCVFLDHNLCVIYDARPRSCRDFPHVTLGSHSLGSRRSSLDRWAALCPILFNALEQYKHQVGFHPHHHEHPDGPPDTH